MSILKIKDSQGNWVGVPTVKGDTGNGISSAILNDDYTLTLTFTDGTTYKTPSIRGEKGEKGEPATDMEIHICSASEYDAETRIPTIANPNDKTFYLVPTEDGTSPDLFTEWVYVNNAWEMFGSAKIDLSGYAEKTDTVLETTLSRGRKSNTTVGIGSVAFGNNVVASGENAHSEGNGSQATGNNSHAEGYSTKASSSASHAEGYNTKATGTMSHAEGMSTTSSGNYSHAEGSNTEATKKDSHAEGHGTQASGEQSHAEGYQTLAMGVASHAEGSGTSAAGIYSHAEGVATTASGDNSHASGTYTIAQRKSQMTIGEYNVADTGGSATSDKGNYILIAGNGTTSSNRSNAMTLDWNGNEKIAGSLTLGADTQDETNISANELKKLKEMNPVDDVQINDTSIVENGVANIPLASDRNTGVIKISSSDGGLNMFGGVLYVNPALSSEIKRGENLRKPIAPKSQHESTFYGLAKASGDTTQSQSSNPVGTYTDEAKASIKNMLGVQDGMVVTVGRNETSDWQADKTFTEINNTIAKGINVIVNDNDLLFPYVGQLYQNNIYWLAFGISTIFNNTNVLFGYLIGDNNGQTIVTQINQNTPIPQIDDSTAGISSVWSSGKIKDELDYKVNDVTINGQSIVSDGVANVPIAKQNGGLGVVKVGSNVYGLEVDSNGKLTVMAANDYQIKSPASNVTRPITPYRQHAAAFYGLAKAAGDTTQSQSSNAVGQYTDNAKDSIQNMLGITPLIASHETDPFESNHVVGELFIIGGKLYRAKTALTAGEYVNEGTNVEVVNTSDVYVKNTDIATPNTSGIVRVEDNGTYGIKKWSSSHPLLVINKASNQNIKAGDTLGTSNYAPIVAGNQHKSVFYGLAKASGDTTQSQSDNAVGTYTDEAKASIQTMLGVPSSDDVVSDVQINGTSIVSDGVANVPLADANTIGLVRVGYGLTYDSTDNRTNVSFSSVNAVKDGLNGVSALSPARQHLSTFYGLAKAAGDTTQSQSGNTVGTYTESAKSAISDMLNGAVQISGTDPIITAKSGIRYVCGEILSLNFTPSASGICDVVFTSGATATVLTVPSTVKWANGFDPTSLDANTTYEINIMDGLGVACAWT